MILDQFGRRVRELRKPVRSEVSKVSIKDRWSTYPSRGLTPERLASILLLADQGDVTSQSELFEEMEEKDTHLSAELLKRKNAVNSLNFGIAPYGEGSKLKEKPDKKDEKVADFCRDVLFSMPDFEDSLFDLLDAIGKGFAASEILWDVDGSNTVITGLKWIHQKRLTFVKDFSPRIITDQNLFGEEIPPFKVVYHRHKARSGYDTRAGMLRVCAWMYLFKNYSIKDWVAFCEVFGMPLRLGKYHPGASTDDKDALVTAIQALGADAAGIISDSTEIEFVEAMKGSTKENVYKALADFCNREISKAIVGATLTTDVGEKGSYAASKTHNEVRLDLVKSDSWSLANTLRMQVLRPLVGFNFGWDAPVPWFQFHLQEPEDLKTLSEVYKNLVEFGQPVSAEHVRDRFGIPMPEEGETLLQVRGPEQPAAPASLKMIMKSAKRDENRFSQEDVDNLSRDGAIAANRAVSALLKPVLDMIEGAESLEEIGEKIYTLYPMLDGKEFEELLAKAMFAAGLTGYAAAEADED